MRVLLAEDNLVNQKLASTLLRKLECIVDVAQNGLEAVMLFESNRYDVILMDCQMPEMDGFEATTAIRCLEQGRERTFIAAMTANALDGDRERCLHVGMDDYITKPVRPSVLEGVLRKCAQHSGSLA